MVEATDLESFIVDHRLKIKKGDRGSVKEVLDNMPKMQIFFEFIGDISHLELEAEYWGGGKDHFKNLRQVSLYPNKQLYGVFYDEMLAEGGTSNIFKQIAYRTDVNEKNEYISFDKIKDKLQYILRIYLNPKKN